MKLTNGYRDMRRRWARELDDISRILAAHLDAHPHDCWDSRNATHAMVLLASLRFDIDGFPKVKGDVNG